MLFNSLDFLIFFYFCFDGLLVFLYFDLALNNINQILNIVGLTIINNSF